MNIDNLYRGMNWPDDCREEVEIAIRCFNMGFISENALRGYLDGGSDLDIHIPFPLEE